MKRSDYLCTVYWLLSIVFPLLYDCTSALLSSMLPSPIKSVDVNKSTEGASLVFAKMSLSLYQNYEPI